MGTGSFPGVKRPGRGVDHPPHLEQRLKKEWSYTSTPPLGRRGLFRDYLYLYVSIYITTSAMGYEGCGKDISSVGIVTKVRAGRSGFRIPEGLRDLSFLRNVLTGCGAHKASYSIRTGGSSSVGQVTLT